MDQRCPQGNRPAPTTAARAPTPGSPMWDPRIEKPSKSKIQDLKPSHSSSYSRSENVGASTFKKKSRREKKEQYRQEPSPRSLRSRDLDQSRRTGSLTIKAKDRTADVRHNKNTEKEVDDAHDEEGEEEKGEAEEEEEQDKEKPKVAHEKKPEKLMRSESDAHLQR